MKNYIFNSNIMQYFFNNHNKLKPKNNNLIKTYNSIMNLPLLYTNPKWNNVKKRLIWKTFNQELEYSKINYKYLYKNY